LLSCIIISARKCKQGEDGEVKGDDEREERVKLRADKSEEEVGEPYVKEGEEEGVGKQHNLLAGIQERLMRTLSSDIR
jgi:hypothetical protein